jgi:GTPase Era involved in 16S rRNA processing
MIVDPHSSLWEADLVCVVHDVSDDYSRNRIDKEVLKCLFAHPEKESVLILNKIDKLKKKNILFDLVADLTGGYLNGKVFLSKDKMKPASRDTLRDFDYESLFAKTAEKMNIKLDDKSEKHKSIVKLLDELKKCEDFLIKNLEDIQIKDESDLLADIEKKELAKTEEKPKAGALQTLKEQRMTLEKLKGSNKQVPMKLSSDNKSISNDLNLVQSIAESTPVEPSAPAIRRIEDISPFDFKQDLLETTDWHLYYKKLSTLGLFVREKAHWPYFNQVFMVSSLLNDGVEELKRYLLSRAKPGDWAFTRNFLTDQMPQEIAEMCVREKLLENLPDEVPYLLGLETAFWEVDDYDCLNIAIKILPGPKSWHFKRHLVS